MVKTAKLSPVPSAVPRTHPCWWIFGWRRKKGEIINRILTIIYQILRSVFKKLLLKNLPCLGWIPRNFKNFIFKPKLSFLRENLQNHKKDQFPYFLRIHPIHVFFLIFHVNSHHWNIHLQKISKIHIKGGFVIPALTLDIIFMIFHRMSISAWKWKFWKDVLVQVSRIGPIFCQTALN